VRTIIGQNEEKEVKVQVKGKSKLLEFKKMDFTRNCYFTGFSNNEKREMRKNETPSNGVNNGMKLYLLCE
jgi:hypothetical protein